MAACIFLCYTNISLNRMQLLKGHTHIYVYILASLQLTKNIFHLWIHSSYDCFYSNLQRNNETISPYHLANNLYIFKIIILSNSQFG